MDIGMGGGDASPYTTVTKGPDVVDWLASRGDGGAEGDRVASFDRPIVVGTEALNRIRRGGQDDLPLHFTGVNSTVIGYADRVGRSHRWEGMEEGCPICPGGLFK